MKDSNIKDPKLCNWCYRYFEYRKKWEKNWDEIKYCSDECRRNSKNSKFILEREHMSLKTLEMTKLRKPKSLCPSEIARDLFENWRPKMESLRQVCRKLFLEQKIIITQKDQIIKDINFKGPIRIKSRN